jgi:glutamate N-acetyltransferase/amino-acid N-acetyltransferase
MIIDRKTYFVPGFLANGIHAGIKEDRKKDLSLIYSTVPARAAAVFTTTAFKAAPVLLDMERIKSGLAQAILTNSGNANAATGPEGNEDARATSSALSKKLKIEDDLVLVASTGVIGHRLPLKKIKSGLDKLIKGLRPDGITDAEDAIMTTDRFPKIAIRKGRIGAKEITLCGMAKGAGMIEPRMATMLAYVMTDADIDGVGGEEESLVDREAGRSRLVHRGVALVARLPVGVGAAHHDPLRQEARARDVAV